jgi:poly(U)-specific endoribonuclease
MQRLCAFAIGVAWFLVPALAANAADIFIELWNVDQANNGMSVSRRLSSDEWQDPEADVLLDEQAMASGSQDRAPKPLIAKVNADKLSVPTYSTLKKLLDNYVVVEGKTEDEVGADEDEDTEIEAFLEAVADTAVFRRLHKHVNEHLVEPDLSEKQMCTVVRRQWFELYENFFRANCDAGDHPTGTKFCSGFEHVFVGECKAGSSGIGGYHYWYTFYLEQEADKADS